MYDTQTPISPLIFDCILELAQALPNFCQNIYSSLSKLNNELKWNVQHLWSLCVISNQMHEKCFEDCKGWSKFLRCTSKPCSLPTFIMSLQRFGTKHITSTAFCLKDKSSIVTKNRVSICTRVKDTAVIPLFTTNSFILALKSYKFTVVNGHTDYLHAECK